ncbi:MAG: dTDP-4-dehydrorhamnose 3,5-epimerase [Bacteroidales bacterium]|nr:dTDP-4-dehydrorhamnose 3,5-epimerase [Bacteroidales bacterium]
MLVKENPLIKGLLEIELTAFSDERGFLMRTFDDQLFAEMGLPTHWEQENHSQNIKEDTLRGLHFLLPPYSDGKLIRCIRGQIYDVAVDLRKGSPTIGKWVAYILSEEDHRYLYLPKGFAHGYFCLQPNSEILYKHDSRYKKEADCGIRWNDEDLEIQWPGSNPLVSEKDRNLQTFQEFITTTGGL